MTEPILSARGLSVGYGKRTVVSGIDLDALRGQVICLLGPNGAGKTTVLRTLSGLLAPVGGTVAVEGIPIGSLRPTELSRKRSLVLTEGAAPSLMTVEELVSLGRAPYTGLTGRLTDEDRRIVGEALETVGAARLRERYCGELSDGERQKVMIARALVQEPRLMILDEPTSHLDLKHKVEVIRVLQRLSDEKHITCILSLHDIDLALKGCRAVLLVRDGKIVAQGTPEEVAGSGQVQGLYELSGARYSELLGAVELAGKPSGEIFVTGGAGSGANLYRALSRNGYGLVSGVLHRGDADFYIAETICSAVISAPPFEPIGRESAEKAFALIQAAKYVVDSGFPVGSGNLENAALLKRAAQSGKPVFSLRAPEEGARLFGGENGAVRYCGGIGSVLLGIGTLETDSGTAGRNAGGCPKEKKES